jgi:hypothetical protein
MSRVELSISPPATLSESQRTMNCQSKNGWSGIADKHSTGGMC